MHKTLSVLAILSAIVSPALAASEDIPLSGTVQATSSVNGKNHSIRDGSKLITTGDDRLHSDIVIQGDVTSGAEPSDLATDFMWSPDHVGFADGWHADAAVRVSSNRADDASDKVGRYSDHGASFGGGKVAPYRCERVLLNPYCLKKYGH